nr:ornithine carbamoyltransferase [Candidatus Woesearchaeota archaeon]
MKHFLSLKNLSEKEILELVNSSLRIKKFPKLYSKKVKGKTMLMMFEKPSLRTRLSLEIAMNQMHGNAIYYSLLDSPLSKGKETIEDTTKVISRYCDLIAARVYEQEELQKIAKNSRIPVINALSNTDHPCQVIGDLATIKEKFGKLKGLTLAYYGDGNSNVINSLIHALPKVGINVHVFAPKKYFPDKKLWKNINLEDKPRKIKADIIYTDTWLSYHVKKSEYSSRIKIFKKFQVGKELLGKALFMHCLPAKRGYEVTSEVIDGKQSIVFDQAGNRLFSAKAVILWCLK